VFTSDNGGERFSDTWPFSGRLHVDQERVARDPLERANVKAREPQRFAALVREYDAWNATMLPLDPALTSAGFRSEHMADRPAGA
jgi:hypothetical protein